MIFTSLQIQPLNSETSKGPTAELASPISSHQGFSPRLAVALSALQFSKRTLPKAEPEKAFSNNQNASRPRKTITCVNTCSKVYNKPISIAGDIDFLICKGLCRSSFLCDATPLPLICSPPPESTVRANCCTMRPRPHEPCSSFAHRSRAKPKTRNRV